MSGEGKTIGMMGKKSIQTKINGVTPKLKRYSLPAIPCPCGCGYFSPSRQRQKYATRRCKDRVRNRIRYKKQKLAVMLAYRTEKLIPTIRRLAEEVLELHESKKG